MSQNFIHLHAHSEYSLLDGVAKIPAYVGKVKSYGMNSAALTDHGVMYGAFEFWQECNYQGIKPIIGCEIYVAERTRFDKTPGIDDKRYHLTLLAKNKEGYHNLLKLVSHAFMEGFYYKPRADRELIEKYGKGLIALSGCLGSNFNKYLMAGDEQKAIKWIKFLQSSVDDVYIELQRNGIKEAEDLVEKQVEIAKKLKLPYVATCDTHYIEKKDHKVQEIVWCISDGKKLEDPARRQYSSTEFYIKSQDELAKLFPDYPEALENT
ncbi:MAG TPA: PHP domain-containing protein, partial [Candidatus Dojkabacteria bacterium]|nr:PHP domain-containing protein [Candidatus Dojkabacteria bacterium]